MAGPVADQTFGQPRFMLGRAQRFARATRHIFDMSRLFRYILVGIVLLAGYALMTYVQQRFDDADLHKAVAAVRAAHPARQVPGGPDPASNRTIEEELAASWGVAPAAIHWESTLTSKWRGIVTVRASAAGILKSKAWEVDLARQQIRSAPANH